MLLLVMKGVLATPSRSRMRSMRSWVAQKRKASSIGLRLSDRLRCYDPGIAGYRGRDQALPKLKLLRPISQYFTIASARLGYSAKKI